MGVNIVIISRDKLQQEEIGILLEEDLKIINELTAIENLKCLNLIDPYDDTTFNKKQLSQIKEEIKRLKKYKQVNQEALNLISIAVEKAINTNCYIQLIGD